VNVVLDDGGPIEIAFAAPTVSFGAYFTYAVGLTLSAYDGLAFLGSVNSLFISNFASSGGTPNELVQIDGLGSFTRITIAGDAFGGSFTMDDLTARPAVAVTAVPEPNVLLLVLAGLALLALAGRRRSSSH
jgi:PEP-CTERM motif